jgi:hypothetical protein
VRSRLAVLPLIAVLACLLAATQASAASPSGVVISKLRLRTAASQFDEYVEIRNTTPGSIVTDAGSAARVPRRLERSGRVVGPG